MLARIENYTFQRVPRKRIKRAFSLLEKSISGFKGKEVSIIFVGEKKIRALNRIYRGQNKATDVLSFDLGDIFINPLQARRQSSNYYNEIVLLAVHGALHLAGYDHKTEKHRREMFAIQDMIVRKTFR